jgi:hypothetical protein
MLINTDIYLSKHFCSYSLYWMYLEIVHVLFVVPEKQHHTVLKHYMKIRAHDVALQSAHFLVIDTESIVDS